MISRPFEPESDMSEVLALLLACKNAETIDCFLPFHLRLILTPRSFLTTDTLNLSTDVRMWEGADRKLVGFALVDISVWGLYYLVDPGEEGGPFEQDILSWAIHRTTEIVQGTGFRLVCAKVRADNKRRISSLERAGFSRGDACGLRMARDLGKSIDRLQVPQGFALRHLSGVTEVPAYVDLVNDIFPNAASVDAHEDWMSTPEYMEELDIIALTGDQSFVGFCQAHFDPLEIENSKRREGWTDPIGVRQQYRNRGLARAVLLDALHRLRNAGIEDAILYVGGRNTAAQRLYESVGFTTRYKIFDYHKQL